jgi:hypothetical protein
MKVCATLGVGHRNISRSAKPWMRQISVNGLPKSPHPFFKNTDERWSVKTVQNVMNCRKTIIAFVEKASPERSLPATK